VVDLCLALLFPPGGLLPKPASFRAMAMACCRSVTVCGAVLERRLVAARPLIAVWELSAFIGLIG
jgi:hypothetical protein